jgi:polar amino acid transport system substrate-binding protein
MNPRATIMRTEDDATAATAYMTGQAELFATNNMLLPDYMKRSPRTEFDLKFTLRRSPAHIAVRMGDFTLLQWLNSFIFFNTMNGELDKLHQKWLGASMQPLPTL